MAMLLVVKGSGDDAAVLFHLRNWKMNMENMLGLPGGGMESQDKGSRKTCAIRESKEEAGVVVLDEHKVYQLSGGQTYWVTTWENCECKLPVKTPHETQSVQKLKAIVKDAETAHGLHNHCWVNRSQVEKHWGRFAWDHAKRALDAMDFMAAGRGKKEAAELLLKVRATITNSGRRMPDLLAECSLSSGMATLDLSFDDVKLQVTEEDGVVLKGEFRSSRDHGSYNATLRKKRRVGDGLCELHYLGEWRNTRGKSGEFAIEFVRPVELLVTVTNCGRRTEGVLALCSMESGKATLRFNFGGDIRAQVAENEGGRLTGTFSSSRDSGTYEAASQGDGGSQANYLGTWRNEEGRSGDFAIEWLRVGAVTTPIAPKL